MKVLVTGAGAVLGQAIIKSLKSIQGFDLEIHAADPSKDAVGLYMAFAQHSIPYAKDNNYIIELKNLIQSIQPEFVFIGTDVELLTISLNKSFIEREFNTHIIVSSPDIIKIADDKYMTYKYLTSLGIESPKTFLAKEVKNLKELNYPIIIKPRIGARSVGVQLVHSFKSLTHQLSSNNDLVIQEYLSSTIEYTAGVIYFDDSNIASIVMKRTLKDGNTFKAVPLDWSWINHTLEEITKKIKPFGPLNFQFKIQDYKIIIFEINARFSGTTYFRSIANFNEIEFVINFIKYKKKITQPKINSTISILRFYDEIVLLNKQLF